MNLLFFGPPGAGKGTQSAKLVESQDFAHLSTGDLFREAIKNQTEMGILAKSHMDKGELVPDSVTNGLVKEKLSALGKKPFILDGYPRNVAQAEALDDICDKLGLKLDKAIFLKVPDDQIVKRVIGRRVCKNCGAVYHIEFKPPQSEEACDACGKGPVVQRADDTEEAIKKRLSVYDEATKPLEEYYTKANIANPVDGMGSADEVFSRIQKTLS